MKVYNPYIILAIISVFATSCLCDSPQEKTVKICLRSLQVTCLEGEDCIKAFDNRINIIRHEDRNLGYVSNSDGRDPLHSALDAQPFHRGIGCLEPPNGSRWNGKTSESRFNFIPPSEGTLLEPSYLNSLSISDIEGSILFVDSPPFTPVINPEDTPEFLSISIFRADFEDLFKSYLNHPSNISDGNSLILENNPSLGNRIKAFTIIARVVEHRIVVVKAKKKGYVIRLNMPLSRDEGEIAKLIEKIQFDF